MHSLLNEIVAEKRKEVARLQKQGGLCNRPDDALPMRDFKGVLSVPKKIGLIAEIKFASPSAGVIAKAMAPSEIGRMYEEAGAAAVSLITDKRFFQGDLNHLPGLKRAVTLPILRKDFIIDAVQVMESHAFGADAVLLIARILTEQKLKDLLALCQELGMAALVEVHDRADMEKAAHCGAGLIGINNRNLDTFEVDLGTTIALAPLAPDKSIVVSESGIRHGKDVRSLKGKGVGAVLVGTSLMKSNDVSMKARELVRAGRMDNDQGQDLRHNRPG
ncbi:MAG: indole-3-glycerol phosphate synthase TrpC [Deltaproteobacteria bacterium]|nr:indole-3-glycerol phosphate synthase TrpC [Deltaproteobacteria bacterium]